MTYFLSLPTALTSPSLAHPFLPQIGRPPVSLAWPLSRSLAFFLINFSSSHFSSKFSSYYKLSCDARMSNWFLSQRDQNMSKASRAQRNLSTILLKFTLFDCGSFFASIYSFRNMQNKFLWLENVKNTLELINFTKKTTFTACMPNFYSKTDLLLVIYIFL